MRSVIAATLVVTAGLVLANMLGVAAAEAPTTTTTPTTTSTTTTTSPAPTVSVDGVASVPIAQGANHAVATSVYREGMAAAVSDGQSKAEFLASKTGTTLGSVQSVVEGGGSIQCTDGSETGYVEYSGEQPDFGSPSATVVPELADGAARARLAPTVHKPAAKHSKKKNKKPSAKAATATSCMLSTDVTLVYALS